MNGSRKLKSSTQKKEPKKVVIPKESLQRAGRVAGNVLWFVLPPILCFYFLECYTHDPFAEVRPWAQFFNILLFEFVAVILFGITGTIKSAYRILCGITMVYGIANAYVVQFRTNPIVPWDILSIKTAASVADNYDFTPTVRMVAATIALTALIVLLHFAKVSVRRIAFWKRAAAAAAVVFVLVGFSGTLQKESFQNSHRLYNKLFTPVYMTNVDGVAVTFVMNLAYMSIEKPAGYDRGEAQSVLEEYDTTSDQTSKEDLPNILVIMDEAFSDLSVLGEFDTNEDYMPFVHSLQQGADNTVTGMLNVSVCGGNTANTEFEFLTGNTMAFLPQGSVPYQQYITGEMMALPEYLRGLGYETVATHPYNAGGWDRDTVYPYLGFDRSVFKEDYLIPHYVRQYISDESCVEKLIEFYETKEEGKPLFAFNVTMQNHGGYQDSYDNFTPDITVTDMQNFSLNQYLSLIRLSDQALEELVTYFSQVDEKTVIVFFGDHQPGDAVAYSILAKNGMQWNNLDEEEQKLRYQVPYVMWANYDIDAETGADTSANYLAAEVLERAGVPLSSYQSYLMDLKEEYPVLSAVRLQKSDGVESAVREEKSGLDTYRKLEYYQLFDYQKK